MTGTAETEAAEFQKIYKLDVTVVPTHRPMIRKENPDVVYRTDEEKFRNAAKEIKEFQERGQPVLVGTISVEKSERLAAMLKKMGVRHEVLNAKNHEREAHIVAQAGRKGAVTVSTNMAGRGTDILLGGNPEAMARDILAKQGKRSRPRGIQSRLGAHSGGSPGPVPEGSRRGSRRLAACISSAPSGTIRGASIISCADAPAAREIPAVRASISHCRTICCASSAATACRT